MMIFYVSQTIDTMYSTYSPDRGNTWEEPAVVQLVEPYTIQDQLFISAFQSITGRILLVWSIQFAGMQLVYSDDKGITWSQPELILGGGIPSWQTRVESLNLSQLNSGNIILSFNVDNERVLYFKQSTDDGTTWSDEATEVFRSTSTIKELTIEKSTNDNLIAIFEANNGNSSGIYKSISTDQGLTWSDTIKVINSSQNESTPKVVSHSDGSLLLAFVREESTKISDYFQNDIYHTISIDGGETWMSEKRFTKYVGNDQHINLSELNDKTLILFVSQRFSGNLQISFGIIEETVESFTPPFIINAVIPSGGMDFENEEFTYNAKVIDDETVDRVIVNLQDKTLLGELYDDGLHNDGMSNDKIFGNTFPFINPLVFDEYVVRVNNIKLPINTKGVIADVNVNTLINVSILASDAQLNEGVMNTTLRLSYGGSGGKFDGEVFLFSAGFYMSGYNGEELWANGIASSSLVQDYQPGKVGTVPDDPLNTIYIIYNTDPPFGTTWMNWKDAVGLGAEFYDGDGDGIYNPVDKNWNGTWDLNEDMPLLIGDVTAWCVYNDGVPDTQRRFDEDPLGIEIEQTVFASSLPNLENVIFYRYKITNTGSFNSNLDSVFFCPWDDTDMGQVEDDLGASDTLISSVFTYNDAETNFMGKIIHLQYLLHSYKVL